MKRFLIIVLLCLVSLSIKADLLQEQVAITKGNIDNKNWFLVEAMECYVPVPKNYILQTDKVGFNFYEYSENKMLSSMGTIRIIAYEEKKESNLNIEFIQIDNSENLEYQLIEQTVRDNLKREVGYIINDNKQSIMVSHVDKTLQRQLADTIYEYCKNHPIQ